MYQPMSPEVLQAAAQVPTPPARLRRAADAVLEGQFSWADAASGSCPHPCARALYSPRAKETVWPTLVRVADELNAQASAEQSPLPGAPALDADDLSHNTYLESWSY